MPDNVSELANALNRVADAIYSLGGTIAFLGFMFLFFKKMSGHNKLTVKHDNDSTNKQS